MRGYDRGVIYTAIGEYYVREAQLSARSVRSFLPDAGIVLFTDRSVKEKGAFDEVIQLTKLSPVPHLEKLVCMRDTPFKETLFLDTDTFACGPLDGLFDLLKEFDIAMAMERRDRDILPEGVAVPAAFCEYNQGVVAYRQFEPMRQMFQASIDWADAFYARTGTPTDDQVAMRVALYASGLRIAVLPLEFNCRFRTFGYLNGTVKILHGRIPGARQAEAKLKAIARKINRDPIPRVFIAGTVYALTIHNALSVEYPFARTSATLFRSWLLMGKAALKRVTRPLARPVERLVKKYRRA
jgi:hypothetical protein